MKIPLSAPDVNEEDIRAVSDVLRTSRLSLGPKLEEFEHAIAAYVGASDAVAVNSGTSALHLCLRALGVGEGDEVIVPSFAFIAVANAVRHERATPVFVDIESDMLNLDTSRIESAITQLFLHLPSLRSQTQFATNGQTRSSSISNRTCLIWTPAELSRR